MKRDIAEKEIKGQAEKSCSKFWNYRNYNKCNCKCWFEISRIRKMARVKEIAISNVIFITHFFFLSFFYEGERRCTEHGIDCAHDCNIGCRTNTTAITVLKKLFSSHTLHMVTSLSKTYWMFSGITSNY